jgi:hypothetical protein
MVSTGGKSVHCYWVLLEPISSEQWESITARLIAHCNSDKACSNSSRVMRLPGSIYYDKKTGEPTGQCRIIAAAGHRYAAFDIDAALPPPAPAKACYRQHLAANLSLAALTRSTPPLNTFPAV